MDIRVMELRIKQWISIIEEQAKERNKQKGTGVACTTLTTPLFPMVKTGQGVSS